MLCKKKTTALSNSQASSTFCSASCIVYNAGKRCCRKCHFNILPEKCYKTH